MDDTRLPKHALNYKPQGRSDRGRPRKQWQHVDDVTGQKTQSMEKVDDDDDDEFLYTLPYVKKFVKWGPFTRKLYFLG